MRQIPWAVKPTGLAFLLGVSCWASISGVVTDPGGTVVSGATVVATDTQTGGKTSVTSDSQGFYRLPTLAIGTYDLEISRSGFKTGGTTGLVIDANSALRNDVSLQVGTTVETMVVNSHAVDMVTGARDPRIMQVGAKVLF